MSRERLELSDERLELSNGRSVPWARIVREDGRPRRHHPRCPTRPGQALDERTVCCDCIYGAIADRGVS